ncbi:MAG: DUF5615 family PIN-like protein [Spirochaetota bacterium]|nr:DUF5615 family PIN-like protein [Spirochaetota bacterium]
MTFVADENIDKPIVEELRKDGYNVLYIQEISPGITDDEVLQLVNYEKAILITSDKDFGELAFRMKKTLNGVILTRLTGLSLTIKAILVKNTIEKHLDELAGSFTVISSDNIRIRKIPSE